MFKKIPLLLFAVTCLLVIVVNSCKKESRTEPQNTASEPAIVQAKKWYESVYPPNSNNLSTTTNPDFSKLIKPDWNHASSYTRFNKKTIELPIDPSSKFGSTIRNMPGVKGSNPAYSRSSFILVSNGNGYDAYVMTIIADSAYLNNDLTKFDRNKYNKRDANFSGMVLYNTPNGAFVSGYTYKNGKGIFKLSASTNSKQIAVQSVTNKQKVNEVICYDIEQDSYWNGVLVWSSVVGQSCTNVDSFPNPNGDGGGAPDGGGFESPGPGGGGTPPPPPAPIIIKTDSLFKQFPCAVKLIVGKLLTVPDYMVFAQPFTTNIKPDLNWKNAKLAWNSPSPITGSANVYELGNTSYDLRSATITLNNNMLQNSSELMIAAASIHETLHAYINYNIVSYTEGFKEPANYSSSKPWLYALDYWAFQQGIPSNYRDHNEMLNDYFSKAVTILKSWDNGAHTDQEYAMAMLYGLDTGDSLPLQGSLNTVFNNMMAKYNITSTQLNNFWVAQLNTTVAGDKLPTSGCN